MVVCFTAQGLAPFEITIESNEDWIDYVETEFRPLGGGELLAKTFNDVKQFDKYRESNFKPRHILRTTVWVG